MVALESRKVNRPWVTSQESTARTQPLVLSDRALHTFDDQVMVILLPVHQFA